MSFFCVFLLNMHAKFKIYYSKNTVEGQCPHRWQITNIHWERYFFFLLTWHRFEKKRLCNDSAQKNVALTCLHHLISDLPFPKFQSISHFLKDTFYTEIWDFLAKFILCPHPLPTRRSCFHGLGIYGCHREENNFASGKNRAQRIYASNFFKFSY